MAERPLFRKPYFILSVSTLSLIFLHQDLSATAWTSNGDAGYVGSGTTGSLVYCIWNAQSYDTITMISASTPQQPLPAFTQPFVTLNGAGYTIDGYSSFTGNTPLFSIATTNIVITDVKIENGLSTGGAGGNGASSTYAASGGGGGGGAAGGAGVYIAPYSSVFLEAPLGITGCSAVGGNGGNGSITTGSENTLFVYCAGGGGGGGFGGGIGGVGAPSDSSDSQGGGGGGHMH